jgi:transcriptional regulator with PAS, ATPase and Fis domain
LNVASGTSVGARFELGRRRTVIGSGPDADIRLGDSGVHATHCEILRVGTELRLYDLGTDVGTLVDGVRVLDSALGPGQLIRVGVAELRVEERPNLSLRGVRVRGPTGNAPAIRGALEVIERAATTDVTVLLEGETGTGKDSAAETIHRRSARAAAPFIVVDCGNIPPNLLESELFGHERGSFTGAVATRQGAFETAAGGTVFLDEIGELATDLQPKLLRVLERREVKPVGASRFQPVDFRLVAATSRDLHGDVRHGRFRKDLYYRLAVVKVRMPPLRERLTDLPLLVEEILSDLGADHQPEAEVLRSAAVQGMLARHAWPGNIRELRNYVERSLTLGLRPPSTEEEADAPLAPRRDEVDLSRPLKESRDEVVRHFEERYLREMLARHSGNVSAAARAAGVDRITFYRLLNRRGLR